MTKTHVFPTTTDTTLATVWRCVNCMRQANPFSGEECDAPTLHAHVDTAAADCDGPVYDSRVETFTDEERIERRDANGVNDFSDIHFMERVMMNVASPYAVHQMTVKVDESGIEVHERTEEGYRAATVRWCHDDCDTDARSYRDVYAEQMNY